MFRQIAAALLVCALPLSTAAFAEDAQTRDTFLFPEDADKKRTRIGYGRLITNDFIGDGDDRWRTGGVQTSRIWGPTWEGRAPDTWGQILELRLGAEIIAPSSLRVPPAGDRPYAGALSAGLHTHFTYRGLDVSAGADAVFTGPSTKLDELQGALHDLLGISQPSSLVTDNQIRDAVVPTITVEAGKDFALADRVNVRPFVEGRAGDETLVRAGFDLTFGQMGQGELLSRDKVTGQRYRTITQPWAGYSFVLGADIAHVSRSIYLPESFGFELTDTRQRVRAGVHWQGESGAAAFYGLTWLGKEFEAQTEAQVLGSVRFNLEF